MNQRQSLRLTIVLASAVAASIACNPFGPQVSPARQTVAAPTTIPASVVPTVTPQPPTASLPCGVGAAPGPAGVDTSNWVVYCDPEAGFGFKYPPGGGEARMQDNGYQIPLSVTPGTNLGEKYLLFTVTKNATACASSLAEGYAEGSLPTSTIAFNGLQFTRQEGSDAGAGNYYIWEAYTILRGSVCVSLSFVLHSTQRLNYPTPPPEYDRAAESAVFQEILATVAWPQP